MNCLYYIMLWHSDNWTNIKTVWNWIVHPLKLFNWWERKHLSQLSTSGIVGSQAFALPVHSLQGKNRLMQHFGIMLAVFGLISFCQVSFFSDCDFDFVKYCKPRLPYLWTRPVIGSVEYKIWSQTLCGFKKETFWCGHFIERKLILMHKAVLWVWDEKLQFGYHPKLS